MKNFKKILCKFLILSVPGMNNGAFIIKPSSFNQGRGRVFNPAVSVDILTFWSLIMILSPQSVSTARLWLGQNNYFHDEILKIQD